MTDPIAQEVENLVQEWDALYRAALASGLLREDDEVIQDMSSQGVPLILRCVDSHPEGCMTFYFALTGELLVCRERNRWRPEVWG